MLVHSFVAYAENTMSEDSKEEQLHLAILANVLAMFWLFDWLKFNRFKTAKY